jgi:Cu-processing system permease protein
MLARIGAIVWSTFREAVRARLLLGLATLALATALYSIAVGEFSLRAASRVVADLGAASISVYAVIASVVLGATSLYRELEQKTLYPILARPISRAEYLVGKFVGMLLTLIVFVGLDAAVVLLVLAHYGGRGTWGILAVAAGIVAGAVVMGWRIPSFRTYGVIPWTAVALVAGIILSGGAAEERRLVLASSALTLFEVMIVIAIATLFSSFSSPFLTAVLTIGLFIVGREADTLARLPSRGFGQVVRQCGRGLSMVVPNLQVYVPPRALLLGGVPGSPLGRYLLFALLQALGWSIALLVLAHSIFRKRDLA